MGIMIADTRTEYTKIFWDMIDHDPGLLLQEETAAFEDEE